MKDVFVVFKDSNPADVVGFFLLEADAIMFQAAYGTPTDRGPAQIKDTYLLTAPQSYHVGV